MWSFYWVLYRTNRQLRECEASIGFSTPRTGNWENVKLLVGFIDARDVKPQLQMKKLKKSYSFLCDNYYVYFSYCFNWNTFQNILQLTKIPIRIPWNNLEANSMEYLPNHGWYQKVGRYNYYNEKIVSKRDQERVSAIKLLKAFWLMQTLRAFEFYGYFWWEGTRYLSISCSLILVHFVYWVIA